LFDRLLEPRQAVFRIRGIQSQNIDPGQVL
jgi:hypothetical protein